MQQHVSKDASCRGRFCWINSEAKGSRWEVHCHSRQCLWKGGSSCHGEAEGGMPPLLGEQRGGVPLWVSHLFHVVSSEPPPADGLCTGTKGPGLRQTARIRTSSVEVLLPHAVYCLCQVCTEPGGVTDARCAALAVPAAL